MSEYYVIVGLGATGLSCARYLKQQGIPFGVTDSRTKPPGYDKFKKQYPDVEVVLGKLDDAMLSKATCIVLSPGVALREPTIAKHAHRGVEIVGEDRKSV